MTGRGAKIVGNGRVEVGANLAICFEKMREVGTPTPPQNMRNTSQPRREHKTTLEIMENKEK